MDLQEISNPELVDSINSSFECVGKVVVLREPKLYVYLDLNDDFIFKLLPLLNLDNMVPPSYFPDSMDQNKAFIKKPIGAHISIIYDNEATTTDNIDIALEGQEFVFKVSTLLQGNVFEDAVTYALKIESPELLAIRKQYQLSDVLDYKGFKLPLHITIGHQLK